MEYDDKKPAALRRQEQVVRLFVSSTFDDLTGERNELQRSVFPKLAQFCAGASWKLQVVDLRWGIRDEAGDTHETFKYV